MAQITINGEQRPLHPGSTLADAISELNLAPQSVATAVNGEFVPRDLRPQRQLQDGDAVFTFQPITGG
ncbi:MAG TPA: sulfur carrier protein ThiS [Ramlibacter sp.]|nr:sulfur carrier protein ThiS [Ramlibacter sp.]